MFLTSNHICLNSVLICMYFKWNLRYIFTWLSSRFFLLNVRFRDIFEPHKTQSKEENSFIKNIDKGVRFLFCAPTHKHSAPMSKGVHQTAQIAKNAPKLPTKWHKCTTTQVTVHCTAPHVAMQFTVLYLWFYNKKIA